MTQEHFPGMSEQEILESMTPENLVKHILMLGEKATQIETKMNKASEVLEGTYGLTVEQVLRNSDTTLVVFEGGENNE